MFVTLEVSLNPEEMGRAFEEAAMEGLSQLTALVCPEHGEHPVVQQDEATGEISLKCCCDVLGKMVEEKSDDANDRS